MSKTTPIKPYTRKELMSLYGVSREVFNSWIIDFEKELGVIKGKTFTIKQVKIIFLNLDSPELPTD